MDVLGVEKDGMADILRRACSHLDYFMPNIEEEMVSGLSTRSDLAGFFLDMGAATVILKMGDQGASINRVGEAELGPCIRGGRRRRRAAAMPSMPDLC